MMPKSQCIWALANSLSGAPFTSFTSARLLIAWLSGGVEPVAVDGGVELVVVNAAGFFGDRGEQRVVSFGVRALQIGDADLQVSAERLFVAAGKRQGELVRAFLQHGGLAEVHAGRVGFGGEFDGLGRAIGAEQLGGHAVVGERLVLRIGKAGSHDDGLAELVAIAFDEQRAARGAAEDAALADVANQLRVEHFEIGWVDAAQPPEFAAADVEDLAGAVELAGQVNGTLARAPVSGLEKRA